MTSAKDSILRKIENREAVIGVVGLGYVGLPLIKAFIEAGFTALGYDIDQKKVDSLMAAKSYIGHIPDEWLESWLSADKFRATANAADLADADAILVCVPTPLSESRDPDLSYVTGTMQSIAPVLRLGQLVVLESTTYPGTTRDVVLPELENSGLKVEDDFFLAYSPEREDPGNKNFTAASIPKVVGGYGEASLEVATALYGAVVVEVVPVSSCESAEACKILENTYRAVNIALVNEMKVLCQKIGVNVWEVIEAAKSKPFGFQAFYPGPGLGGHCIPIDPFYMSWVARKHGMTTRFVELAGEINSAMPEYVLSRLTAALNEHAKPVKGSKILILGMAYKPDVDDERESPSFVLLTELCDRGAEVAYNDPYIPKLRPKRAHDVPPMESQPLTPELLAGQDCVLIATNHSDYDYDFIVKHANMVVDTRNATAGVKSNRDKIVLS